MVPQWLYDERLYHQASSNFIIDPDGIYCVWCPIAREIVEQNPENYSTYIYLVNKITQLQMIRLFLDDHVSHLMKDFQGSQKTKMANFAINAVVQWMGSMSGMILHMDETGHYSESELIKDKENAPDYMKMIEPSFRWILHTGELLDTSPLMRLLPYGNKIEKTHQTNKKNKTSIVKNNDIFDMKGTCFEGDELIRSIYQIMISGLFQPNKIRKVDDKIIDMLRTLLGILKGNGNIPKKEYSKSDEIEMKFQNLYDILQDTKNSGCIIDQILISSVRSCISSLISTNADIVFSLWKQPSKSHERLEGYDLSGSPSMKRKLYEMLIHGLREYEQYLSLNHQKQVSKQRLKVPEIAKEFFGYNQKNIRDYMIKLLEAFEESAEHKKSDIIDIDIRDTYDKRINNLIVKLLSFQPTILAQNLPTKRLFGIKVKNFIKCLAMAGKIKSPSHDLLETLSIVRSERDQLDDIDDTEQNMDDDKDDTDSDDDDSDDDSDDDDKKGKSRKKKKKKKNDKCKDKPPSCFIPQWSRLAQKKVTTGEAFIDNIHGGHNAHRLLKYIMMQFGISLLGDYNFCTTKAPFFPMLEIYRFLQFDYPSIDDFIKWWKYPLPLDFRLLGKKTTNELSKKLSQYIPDIAKPKNGINYCEADISSDIIQKVYNDMTVFEGSFTRRYGIVTFLRENCAFMTNINPSIKEVLSELYDWNMIENNIIDTMDINRCNIYEILNDRESHLKECRDETFSNADCNHCLRWKHVLLFYHKDLVKLYERWPVIFAFDVACQAQKSRPSKAKFIVYKTKLLGAISEFSAISTYNSEQHKQLLKLSPRPSVKTFEQSIIDVFNKIGQMFSDSDKLFKSFTTEGKRTNSFKNLCIKQKCQKAIEIYEASQWYYNNNYKEFVEGIIMCVLERFNVHSNDFGIHWMIMMLNVHPLSINYILTSRSKYNNQENRTLGEKALLRILTFHRKDYFILRTFYTMLVRKQKISVWPIPIDLRHRAEKVILDRVNKCLPNLSDHPSDYSHLSTFYMCYYHGTLQAAKVGTEYGKQGEKNTKSSGHDRISNSPNDAEKYCSANNKSFIKLKADDQRWNCLKSPNVPVQMSGVALNLFDTINVQCPYCANIMNLRWEKMAGGGLDLWCGQCIEGMKKRAEHLGYVWSEKTNSITPCARPINIGGIPVLCDGCAICITPRSSSENLSYHLMWVDTRNDGSAYLAYVPFCGNHSKQRCHGETWLSLSLTWLSFVINSKSSLRNVVIYSNNTTTSSSSSSQSNLEKPAPAKRGRKPKSETLSRLNSSTEDPSSSTTSSSRSTPISSRGRGRGRGRGSGISKSVRLFFPNNKSWNNPSIWKKLIPNNKIQFSSLARHDDDKLKTNNNNRSSDMITYNRNVFNRRGKASKIPGFKSARKRY